MAAASGRIPSPSQPNQPTHTQEDQRHGGCHQVGVGATDGASVPGSAPMCQRPGRAPSERQFCQWISRVPAIQATRLGGHPDGRRCWLGNVWWKWITNATSATCHWAVSNQFEVLVVRKRVLLCPGWRRHRRPTLGKGQGNSSRRMSRRATVGSAPGGVQSRQRSNLCRSLGVCQVEWASASCLAQTGGP